MSDQGRGIHHEDVDTILDEFARGRLAEDDGGTGLGLGLRELVAQQRGSVSIDSRVGDGTTVTVELPSPQSLKPSAPAQRSSWTEEPASSPTGQSPG